MDLSTTTRQMKTTGKRTVDVGVSRGGAPFEVVSERGPIVHHCHECGVGLTDGDDIHTARNGEDVCENCCNVCAAEQ